MERWKKGRRARNKSPKRRKPEEKENASAQWPRAAGIRPPPSKNPIKMIRDTATLRRFGREEQRDDCKPDREKADHGSRLKK